MASHHHRAGVVHMSHAYVATCSCGWLGGDHQTPGPAEQEAADHEANPEPVPVVPWSPLQRSDNPQ